MSIDPNAPAAATLRHVYVSGGGGWCIRCGARKGDPVHEPAPVSFCDLAKELPTDAE